MKIPTLILIGLTVVSQAETLELNPVQTTADRRAAEALSILTALDLPRAQLNSPHWVYQITPHTLALVRAFGTDGWDASLAAYHQQRESLADQYAMNREMQMIPLRINGSITLALTPGAHSQLIKDIITDFCPRYAPGSEVLYVGDTGVKMGHFDQAVFAGLGLAFDSHGKMPDVVLYQRARNWLFLIESVTSHGPVDAKRYAELSELFKTSTAGIVYVTAFPDRPSMAKYVDEISWESEVWIADSPTHLIHFNGTRFFGPYEAKPEE